MARSTIAFSHCPFRTAGYDVSRHSPPRLTPALPAEASMEHPPQSGPMPDRSRSRFSHPISTASFALLAAGMLVLTGCQQDTTGPSNPEDAPALAASSAGTLTFSMVSIGGSHSCGVTTDSRAYCWGDNSQGELGDGSTTDRSKPVLVAGGLRFSSVSAGNIYTCGLTTLKKAYCWGSNGLGQLGDGTTTERHTPVAVKGGLVFRQIRPGTQHTCGATTTNVGYCWGWNPYGQLGNGSTDTRLTPTRVAGSLKFLRVIAGGRHSCGLTTTNRAFCWGDGSEGQIGDGKTYLRYTPRAVAGGLAFKQLVAGGGHSCGVTTADRAYCWGMNDRGQLGIGTRATESLVPTAVAGGHHFAGVSPAFAHTCGVTTQQVMLCWGWNLYGQLNVDPVFYTKILSPISVRGTFTSVGGGLGHSHTCGVSTSGTAYCWGANFDGQLGDGTITSHSEPQPVLSPS